jgi:predicted O-methyltransferase YrrM
MTRCYEFTSDWHSGHAANWTAWLAHLAGQAGVAALEIGSHEGRSAIWLLEHVLTDPWSSLVCVDPWLRPEVRQRFDRNLIESGCRHKVRAITGQSRLLPTWIDAGTLDLVYVDGSHEGRNVLQDGLNAIDLLRPGGTLILDDYRYQGNPDWPQHHLPGPAIDALLQLCDWQLDVIHVGYQVCARRR